MNRRRRDNLDDKAAVLFANALGSRRGDRSTSCAKPVKVAFFWCAYETDERHEKEKPISEILASFGVFSGQNSKHSLIRVIRGLLLVINLLVFDYEDEQEHE